MLPAISGLVVHWHAESALARLCRAWPEDPRFELLVVDNGSDGTLDPHPGQLIAPGRNLGFGAALNLAASSARAPLLLLLNPDVTPTPGALEALLRAFDRLPDAAGLAPRLLDDDGSGQESWQLRNLPRPGQLLLQALFLDTVRGGQLAAGERVEQPAAACLALRRSAFEAMGGLDCRFFPAWFEDVDLAARLAASRLELRYWPRAVFHHSLGQSVGRLGWGRFLRLYHRNLRRYLAKHHGRRWALAAAAALPLGAFARLLILPLRAPRSVGRRAAAAGLLGLLVASLSDFHWPSDEAMS